MNPPEQFVEIKISAPRKRLDVPGPHSNRHERRAWMARKRQEARQEAKHAAERAAKRDEK